MKILHLTDIHSDLTHLDFIRDSERIDLIILSGDITHFGQKDEAKTIIDKITAKLQKPVLAVTGNCDYPEISAELSLLNVSVENKVVYINDFQVCGIGGSLPCPGTTPNEYPEKKYVEVLYNLETSLSTDRKTILVSHQPPYKTKNDKVLLGFHVGSKAVRKFIEKIKPLVCLTGHIHEGKGIDYIGECRVINPGPFRNGRYAFVELTGEQPPEISVF